jgi:hypothetical protein
MPDEVVDVYSDQFQINTGPYGSVLNFLLTDRQPAAPGAVQPAHRVATVRMSLEHLKIMTFILRRQIMNHERATGIRIQLPQVVLNALQIGREDWNECWRED